MRFRQIWVTLLCVGIVTVGLSWPIQASDATNRQVVINNSRNSVTVSPQQAPAKVAHPQLSAQIIHQDVVQLRDESFRLINHDRNQDNRLPLKRNHKLDRLAMIRAHQVEHRFSHYDHQGYPMTTDDAGRANLPHGFRSSENIASAGLGACMLLGDTKTYHNHDGNDMARMDEDAMMHYDGLEANGHRKNILSDESTLVGVGSAYNPKKHKFYVVEDFGDRNADSSQDVEHASKTKKYQTAEHTLLKQEWHQTKKTVGHWIDKTKHILSQF